ncbi:hypothetical protein QBZ16_000850 [Prototheca wickerhamii]|uniref:Uncharacterized protein n=1 Tax=Prototheca wickerhamii TaxID=3111 RepID=A0AAD9IDU2_PROWI|nr:hypothetical protein QBZ16_000850 [Prototheca wickerhamii]
MEPLLDRALVARFPAPRSFTGDDCLELHLHGGAAVVQGLLDALRALPGLRPAEPGEFTRRAFEVKAGKLDLTEVEGLADLLAAQTAAQRRQALALVSGSVRAVYARWRAELLRALAAVEAVIDFGEDEGIADEVAAAVRPRCAALRAELAARAGALRRGRAVREGVRVALVGAPNAGKSSLLNALAGRDAAIVSPFPGTTRDVLETALELAGARVLLTDAAGIRETHDPVEAEGVRRARAALRAAHIRHRRPGDPAAAALVTRERHADALRRCVAALDRYDACWDELELASEELRAAVRAMGSVTGEVGTEEVLDSVFGEFCIGK